MWCWLTGPLRSLRQQRSENDLKPKLRRKRSPPYNGGFSIWREMNCNLMDSVAGLPPFVERFDETQDLVVHLPQSLYDNLRFRPTKLSKSYLRNELSVALEISSNRGDGKFLVLISPPEFNRKPSRACAHYDDQFSMLVHDVHLVDGQEKGLIGVRSLVRLALFNQRTDSGIGDALYFSFVLGKHVRRSFLQDGKFDKFSVFGCLPESDIGKMPNDVIEARPQVVDDFSGQDAESGRNLTASMVFECLRNHLLIVVAEDRVYALIEKGRDFGLKITDVLVGPI